MKSRDVRRWSTQVTGDGIRVEIRKKGTGEKRIQRFGTQTSTRASQTWSWSRATMTNASPMLAPGSEDKIEPESL